jgi:hypothetical protein
LKTKGISMADSPNRIPGIEQRVSELEADVRIHFDIFSGRLDTIRAEGNLHHSEHQLHFTSLHTTQTTILRLLHDIDERLRSIEQRLNQP